MVKWYFPEELNDYTIPIICWTNKGKCVVFSDTGTERHWIWLCAKYNIKYWMPEESINPEKIM